MNEGDNINEETQDLIENKDFEDAGSSVIDERRKEARALASQIMKKIEVETPDFVATDEVKFKPPKEVAQAAKKKKTKPQLVSDIMKLQEQLNLDNPRPRSHFERMNKPELEETLAYMASQGVNKLKGEDINEEEGSHPVDEEGNEVKEATKVKTSKKSIEQGAKALFQLHILVTKVAELTSVNFKEQIGTDLKGLSQDSLDNREQLEEILGQIYEEYSDEISAYISPLNQYALLMISMGTHRAIMNRTRVEEELKKKA